MSTWVWPGLKPCSLVDIGVPSSYSWPAQLQAFISLPPSPPVFDTFLHAVNLNMLDNHTGVLPASVRTIVSTPVSPRRDSNSRPHQWN